METLHRTEGIRLDASRPLREAFLRGIRGELILLIAGLILSYG